MTITYREEPELTAVEFREVLIASTLGERRPVDDLARLATMLAHAQVILTARDAGRLVGVSRAITDRAFATYLTDLAVDVAYQGQGIGRQLITRTHAAAGLTTTLVLVSAPGAESFYPTTGMTHHHACWKIDRTL